MKGRPKAEGLWERARVLASILLGLERLRLPVAFVLLVTVGGAVGYALLLDLGALDALYQSLTTLSTVGFQEIVPFTPAAKAFTIGLILTGVGAVFYTLTLVVATVVEGDLHLRYRRRLMMRRIESMQDHYLVCGFGRVGEEIARGFAERGTQVVVVDPDPAAVEKALSLGFPTIHGSATEEPVLLSAGIERAHSLLAAANSDAQNVYIALTAKKVRPDLHIVARSEVPSSEEKLKLAGVSRVVSPHALSGRRMMLAAVQPLITDFVDTLATGRHGEQILAELEVRAASPLDGATLAEAFASAPGTTVLGLRTGDGRLVVGPRGDTRLHEGDRVIVLAGEAQLALLHAPASARTAQG